MSRIQIPCRSCGVVVLAGETVDLILWAEQSTTPSHCTFRCSVCSRRTVTPIEEEHVPTLLELGARIRRYGILPEASEQTVTPEPPPVAGAPPLSLDDVLELHQLLKRHDWWEYLLDVDRRRP
jgi:hypothetical protein